MYLCKNGYLLNVTEKHIKDFYEKVLVPRFYYQKHLFLSVHSPYFQDFSLLATINNDVKATLIRERKSNLCRWNFLINKEQGLIK